MKSGARWVGGKVRFRACLYIYAKPRSPNLILTSSSLTPYLHSLQRATLTDHHKDLMHFTTDHRLTRPGRSVALDPKRLLQGGRRGWPRTGELRLRLRASVCRKAGTHKRHRHRLRSLNRWYGLNAMKASHPCLWPPLRVRVVRSGRHQMVDIAGVHQTRMDLG